MRWCRQDDSTFGLFETGLLRRLLALSCVLVRLFFTARRQRLDGSGPQPARGYRLGNPQAERTWQRVFGPVRSVRAPLLRQRGGAGYYPLDVPWGERGYPGQRLP